ncbi:heme peroxidase [Exophiala dermatitidis]|uniref:Peroxidase n=2 Tax=Exophiala dermatitidis TaxID=5970 RepID=H6BNY4_EXODN|nr:cytochrome c peroxidase [Exophiala dermatitidis NIH/UT8656]KAJ4502081.1 heme peroxidase [Exophiala dermatitidis]EHY52402.1 cytochrome c peroxidase [Exophiala dermatitidis NIH/UT8656]KAJ4502549.1 heme peroxidase [Exophiala dermatitidis]KAJ4503036.1 heme peroxidase [Exophiala dermatitidis]KAJ4531651.1 heme peroxidase [Exophiala dermatitidis]
MATAAAARTFTKAFPRSASSATSSLRLAARPTRNNAAKRVFQQSSRRQYSSAPEPAKKSSTGAIVGGAAAAALLAGGLYFYTKEGGLPEVHLKSGSAGQSAGLINPTKEDYQKVYNAVAKALWEHDEYEDGSYGPVVLRLAWHASGTYDAATGTGGSNGATMRFSPEADHGANAGLKVARDFLEPIKQQFPWISYSDLWTLAGVCAIQEMQGPKVPWRPGRQDRDVAFCTPDGRLPDGSKDQNHIRQIFGRMGFNDQEMVALSGAHALGRCHVDRSGFDGPWTFSPTVLTNDYYRLLLEEKWDWRKWNGPKQYQDVKTKSLMMLPTDMALIKDPSFRKYVEIYAKDNDRFFKDFSAAVCKLFELGVPFKSSESDRIVFKTYSEQEESKEE